MEKFLMFVLYGIFIILLLFGFWYSIAFTVMLLKEIDSVFMGLLVILTEIFCLCGVINILKRMF